MGKRYAKEVKEEVLRKIREGQRVSEVARSHGINEIDLPPQLVPALIRVS